MNSAWWWKYRDIWFDSRSRLNFLYLFADFLDSSDNWRKIQNITFSKYQLLDKICFRKRYYTCINRSTPPGKMFRCGHDYKKTHLCKINTFLFSLRIWKIKKTRINIFWKYHVQRRTTAVNHVSKARRNDVKKLCDRRQYTWRISSDVKAPTRKNIYMLEPMMIVSNEITTTAAVMIAKRTTKIIIIKKKRCWGTRGVHSVSYIHRVYVMLRLHGNTRGRILVSNDQIIFYSYNIYFKVTL